MSDINKQSDKELEKSLKDTREDLRKFRFSISGSRAKDVKAGKNFRKKISQILTEINTRQKNV